MLLNFGFAVIYLISLTQNGTLFSYSITEYHSACVFCLPVRKFPLTKQVDRYSIQTYVSLNRYHPEVLLVQVP